MPKKNFNERNQLIKRGALLAKQGMYPDKIAEQLGVTQTTIYRWSKSDLWQEIAGKPKRRKMRLSNENEKAQMIRRGALLAKQGLYPTDIAEQLGVTFRTVYNWEKLNAWQEIAGAPPKRRKRRTAK